MIEHIALGLSVLAILLLACRELVWRGTGRTDAKAREVTVAAPAPADAAEALLVETLCQDIRGRTNGIVGLAELLLSAPLDEEQLRQAELIADSGRAMLRLMADVLDVSRIDAGGVELQTEPSDLREMLQHQVSLMQASARTRGLTLALMVDDAVPAQVLLDRSRLRQVMLNLIGNAIKFTERGQIEVQARVAQTAAGPQLAISVIDPGVGIPRERQAEIFQPFFRQKPAPTPQQRPTAGSGTGLGLALSNRIVQAMGGEIALESAPGLGSCFTVRLPLVSEVEPEFRSVMAPGPGDLSLAGRRVLVVEDHSLGRDVLLVLLQSLGIQPTKVASGEAALAEVAQADRIGQPFELVLMDMRMPGMDGTEATHRLRTAGYGPSALPVVALLAADRADDLASMRAGRFQGHVFKPVEIDTLARTLREVLWASDSSPPGLADAACLDEQGPDMVRRLTADPMRLRELEARYHLRKEALFANMHSALTMRAADADWDTLAAQLHRLAGVAANFGDRHLGDLARRLHGDLRTQSCARRRHRMLQKCWNDLQAAR